MQTYIEMKFSRKRFNA